MCVLTPEFDPNPLINAGGPCTTPRPPGGQGVPFNCFNSVTTTGPIGDLTFPVEIFYYLADSRTLNAGPTGNARLTVRLAIEARAAQRNGTHHRSQPGHHVCARAHEAGTELCRRTARTPSSTRTDSSRSILMPPGPPSSLLGRLSVSRTPSRQRPASTSRSKCRRCRPREKGRSLFRRRGSSIFQPAA